MDFLNRMLEEEKLLEAEMYGKKETVEPTDDQKADSTIPNVDTFEEDTVDQKTEPEAPTEDDQESKDSGETPEEKKSRQSWKKRHTSYKAATDKTIYQLRQEVSRLNSLLSQSDSEMSKLREQIYELSNKNKDPFGDVITEDDITAIGPEAVDIIKRANSKATEKALEPLKEQIEAMKLREARMQREAAEERERLAYGDFLGALQQEVPDYREIDVDPKFKEFMAQPDTYTGQKRLDLFLQAERYKDAFRVAEFFKEFKESLPQSKKSVLENKITPESSSATSVPEPRKGETFTIDFVEQFFDDVAKGKYRGKSKEADAIEARITKAYVENRITY